MMHRHTLRRGKRITAVMLCFLMISAICLSVPSYAESKPKNIRVGWYESPFNSTDDAGRRSGYAYDYQIKIASYAGWDYTYVSGSWPDLLQMLIDGKIDMLSDVSYTEERAEQMLFPDLPMGTEEYYIYISPKNEEITADDYSTLNGKRIGANKSSVQLGLYKDWAEQHEIDSEAVELNCSTDEALEMLNSGTIDAYVSMNAYGDPEKLVPVCKIGSSDFYFAVSKDREDLLADLNMAMDRIQAENPYYNQQMFEKYVQRFATNAFLTSKENAWLDSHGAIRVGYQDNYLAFCAQDPETGALTGALKDYLEAAADCIADTHIDFEAIPFDSTEAAFKALKEGEIDCVFPANLPAYDGETQNLLITPALMRTDVYAVVRQTEKNTFTKKEHVIVAVNEGNPNYTSFLKDSYPEWRAVYFPSTGECLKAVSSGIADCVLISTFRYNSMSRLCKQYRLTTYATGVGLDYCFAVNEGEPELYSIVSKTTGLVPSSAVNAALSFYIAENSAYTFSDFITDNLGAVSAVTIAVVLVILLLFIRSRNSEKKAKKLISATEFDALTGLYNRDYFFQYADRMYHDHPETHRDALVLNIEQFHSINALNGWEFGNQVLRVLGNEVFTVAKEFGGIGGRFGADRFDIYCRHIEDYQAVFNRLQNKMDALASNASVRLRMGVMPWQEGLEPIQLFDRARTACNMARGNYMEHLILFDEKIRERELIDQRLLNDLRSALDNEEFEIYYQPKFDIRPEKPKLIGAEALIRWLHPEMGMIMPNQFIPLFEHNGNISEIDKYVWAKVARQIADWRDRYGLTIPVSVNLSRVDIFDSELENTLDEILEQEGLEHEALELELTESAYTENADQLIHVAKKLHRKGYIIEMDDFGTGYSSLNMLSAMPIDVLKMDRSFIVDNEQNEKKSQMVSLILGIAKNLGISVVAEGAENESQISMLKESGCAYVQGYYYSQPIHPSEFEVRFLNTDE